MAMIISLFIALLNFLSVYSDAADWMSVSSKNGNDIPFDLEKNSLEIKTNSAFNSQHEMAVNFKDSNGDVAGGVRIVFKEEYGNDATQPEYHIFACTKTGEGSAYIIFWTKKFEKKIPNVKALTWRITKTKVAQDDIKVQIFCNNELVADVKLSDSECPDTRNNWKDAWNRKVTKMFFSFDGDYRGVTEAAVEYRAVTAAELKCEVPTITGGEVSPSNAISPGSSYTVTCKSGYTLKGSSDISCAEDNGKATLSTSPTCEKDKDEDKNNFSFANSPKASALLLLFLIAFLVN